jgi:hypothetical protein
MFRFFLLLMVLVGRRLVILFFHWNGLLLNYCLLDWFFHFNNLWYFHFGFNVFWLFRFFLLGFLIDLMGRFDITGCLFGRLGAGVFQIGIVLDGTKTALVDAEVSAMVRIIDELEDSIGEESGVREVSKGEFGEEEVAVAGDFKGTHFLSPDLEDGDRCFGEVVVNGLLEFFREGEVGGFVVARAPGVLLAVGADLDRHLHERNLFMI